MQFRLDDSISEVKGAFAKALEAIPGFHTLSALKKGDVVDKSFKILMEDLMKQFEMVSGQDYVENLRNNEPGADFVICSNSANELIKDLLEGRVIVVKEHTKFDENGNTVTIKPYFKRLSKV